MTLFEWIYHIATQNIAHWGYLGLVVGMALESACMPVPSEVILPFGGYLVSTGQLTFWGAVLAGLAGGTIGSTLAYAVGWYGGRPFILKYGRYILLDPEDLDRADRLFDRYGNKIVFWARFMPVVRTFISLPAGIAGMNFKKFLLYTVAGSLPWTILFIYIGVKLGQHWDQVRNYLARFDYVIITLVLIFLLWWIVGKIRKKASKKP